MCFSTRCALVSTMGKRRRGDLCHRYPRRPPPVMLATPNARQFAIQDGFRTSIMTSGYPDEGPVNKGSSVFLSV